MKRVLPFLFAIVALCGCGMHMSRSIGWSGNKLTAMAVVTNTFALPANVQKLVIDNTEGDVRVTGIEHGAGQVGWKLTAHALTTNEAEVAAHLVQLETKFEGGVFHLIVKAPTPTNEIGRESSFEITVPKSVAVTTESRFGRTDITGLDANADISNQNGEVAIHSVKGTVHARTTFAALVAGDIGPATLKDQNGEMDITEVHGALEAETSFASLVAKQVHGPATLNNRNGDVKALEIEGALTAQTSFGPITAFRIGGPVSLRDRNGSVEAVTIKGDADIKTSFDGLTVQDVAGNAKLENQNGGIFANGVTGSVTADTVFAGIEVKGNGAEFVCRDHNGPIRISATSGKVAKIDADTSFDALELHLPRLTPQPVILASTTFGDVESDYPVLKEKPDGPAVGALQASLQNRNGNIRVYRD